MLCLAVVLWPKNMGENQEKQNDEMTVINQEDLGSDAIETVCEEGWQSYLDERMKFSVCFPENWQVETNEDYGYPETYLAIRSDYDQLRLGYDFNTRVEIAKNKSNKLEDAIELLESRYDGYKEDSLAEGWSQMEWTRNGNVVTMDNPAPFEGLPYRQITYFLESNDGIYQAELTVPNVEAYGFSPVELEDIGRKIIESISWKK